MTRPAADGGAGQSAVGRDENRVTGPYTAVVNGRSTGLAGCSVMHQSLCESADRCLRAAPGLARPMHPMPTRPVRIHVCSQFIAKATGSQAEKSGA